LRKISKFLWLGLGALTLRACVIEPVRLTDDYMAPTLQEGDLAFVSKVKYGLRVPGSGAMLISWAEPQKGDLVVAVNLGDPPATLMRRIGGLPGEKVPGPEGAEITLKDQEYFLVADSKGEASDSRRFGPVPQKSLLGKVSFTWITKKSSTAGASKVESVGSNRSESRPKL
jgi:signal peptidase I